MIGTPVSFTTPTNLRRFAGVVVFCLCTCVEVRAETMVQYFNTSWVEITNKMPELAEAGYGAIWLPPPTKGSGGLSVGYDMWDPFDLGSKDQRGSVKTRYGTEAELIRLVETAHRFGIRIYFDNIMNHRAFDVPGYNSTTPIDLYPGLVPEDFHLRLTQDGFYRKWDNTRSWSDSWQVQQLGLADLIDIAQEPGATNLNFGTTEGSTWPKIKFIRDFERPEQYCYDKDGVYIGFGGLITLARQPANLGPSASDAQAKAWAQAYLNTNKPVYEERVEDYLNRAARWLIDRTKADGLRLDAVKHIHADFFGATFGADKDSNDYGYSGQVQRQFNLSRGFSDANHRDSVFNTETGRDDAMLFGEHLGEPPAYSPYIDAGMRLVDNPLRQQLNDKLGNPSNGLNGFENSGAGGFSASTGVMHAQSHDNDYAARRELQHAFYFTRAGMGLLYTDGNYQAETLGESGGAFPRHANTAFLGQWGDGRVPSLLYMHDQFARGYQQGVGSDADLVAYERIDKRLDGAVSDADGVTMIFLLNDNYANGQRPYDRSNFISSFPPGAYLHQYARGPASSGDSMTGFYVTMQDAGNGRSYFPDTVTVPRGGYYVFSWKNPDPADGWQNAGGRPVTIQQGGVDVGTVDVTRKDGPNGDAAFNGSTLPDSTRPVLPTDAVTTDYKYTARIPRVTDGSAVRFIARVDGSAENVLMRLDGGIDLNGTVPVGNTDPALRDNPPGIANDMFLGYEQPTFIDRSGPEKFAATDTTRCIFGSVGAETFTGGAATVNGTGANPQDGASATFDYHDPLAGFEGYTPTNASLATPTQYYVGASSIVAWAKTNSVGGGFRAFLYYTNDGSNPEGAGGTGTGTTKTVEMFYTPPNAPDGNNWWRGEITPKPAGTIKYKIAILKTFQPSEFPGSAGSVERKTKMMTTFETGERDLTAVQFRPHDDYGVAQTGLSEGMHIIRARTFLKRTGLGEPNRAPIYNTFAQTFYYDAQSPTGEIRFPENNGDTVGDSQYGAVVRTDPSVTEVWYNITDSDGANDDFITRSLSGNGNGFEPFTDSDRNGVRNGAEKYEDLNGNGQWDSGVSPNTLTSWVRASEATPSLNVQPGNAAYTKEWRFNFNNIPASGTATIKVRLRELSSAAYKDFDFTDLDGHYTTLTRTVNCAGPNERLFIAWPPQDGDSIDDTYEVKAYFSKTLIGSLSDTDLIEKFVVRIGSTEANVAGALLARTGWTIYRNETTDYAALGFKTPNLWNDQPDYLNKIGITFDRTSPLSDLAAERLVKALPSTKPRVSIVSPPELDSDGKAYQIILPKKASPTAADRQFVIRVSTSIEVASVNITVNSGPMTVGSPTVTTEGNNKLFDFVWSGIQEGEFRFTATAFAPGGENFDTRSARVVFREVVSGSDADPDDDDDGLLDIDEATATPLPNGYPTTDPKYKPNSENWTNGDVHVANAFGKTNPLSPDTDGDGLPDALEVGWRAATAVGETFSDVGFGTPLVGAGNGLFDFTDTNGNGLHDAGEPSEPFTDANANNKFDFGTITTRDTDGDGFPNFIGDLDPPFYNTTDNIGKVPGVNTLAEGGDRAKQVRGSVTNPNDPDTDHDGIPDGIEDANHDGWLQNDGASLGAGTNPALTRTWPNGIRDPGEVWTETNPNDSDTDDDGVSDGFGEDKNFNGHIDGDTNNNRVHDTGELWTETDPLNADTDGDGLPDGWEIKYGLDPLDSGTLNLRTGGTGLAVNGASGDADGDGFTNIQELTNGTDPKKDNTAPPLPPGNIVIGPRTPVTFGAVTNAGEFTDWTADDLIALDEYDGDGTNNQGTDIYKAYDGFDTSRDIVAFYARDGGSTAQGGDDMFYFRIDFHDLVAHAEDGGLDAYVVMDFGGVSTATTPVGEYKLPDDVDTGTQMRWEVVVAAYANNNGAVYVDTNPASNSTSLTDPGLSSFGVVRRDQNAANGFGKVYYDSQIDAMEFSISRQALIDAGWNGLDPATINYQVFTTKDGTQNSPTVGAGDLGGRSDIRDSITDDWIASSYWRDQTTIAGAGSVLKSWVGLTATNDRRKRAKVISLLHEARPVLPGSEAQDLINTGLSAGFYRPLDAHEALGVPFALHIPATLASAFQWAKVDPGVNKPWRDGPAFNARLAAMKTAGLVDLLGATFSSHPLPYAPASFTQDNLALANEVFTSTLGGAASSSVIYPPERVVDERVYATAQTLGFNFTLIDQMRHVAKWFGRSSALSDDGYRINRVNGVKNIVVSDQASGFRFQNTDRGLNTPLRELLSRKSRSGTQDQVIVLHSDWSDFLSATNASAYDDNIRWIASHPWIQLVTPDQIAAGQIDITRDGVGDVWPVVERGTTADLALVAKDWVDHASQENYDNWYFGQALREESLSAKLFDIRTGVPLALPFGQIGVSGIANLGWNNATTVSATFGGLRTLARCSAHASMYLTAFHDQSNHDLTKFSTGDYINPDTTMQNLAGFAKAAQAQIRWAAVYNRVSTWAQAANAGTYLNSAATEAADVDLDGENEFLFYNDRVFAVCEAIGGRMTAAWVRDLATGNVLQVIGNPVGYSGFDSEIEGAANVIGGKVGSYRTSAFKDWWAAGPDSIQYNNDLYTVTAVTNGWRFTSSDGKIQKSLSLAARSNSVAAGYTLDPAITTLYVRHGLSPNLLNLIKKGQSTLGSTIVGLNDVSLINSAPGETVRAYLKLSGGGFSGTTYNAAAVDDDPGNLVMFDTVNMRNQAQTQQFELSGATSMSFALGLETGSTLSNDTDNDSLPDAWENANGLNSGDPNGANGASGDVDGDGMSNRFEYIVGKNPTSNDSYLAGVAKVAGGFTVSFDTIPDRFYQVYYSDDLSTWTALGGDVTGDGSTKTITDDGTASTPHPNTRAQRFYKVEVRLINP